MWAGVGIMVSLFNLQWGRRSRVTDYEGQIEKERNHQKRPRQKNHREHNGGTTGNEPPLVEPFLPNKWDQNRVVGNQGEAGRNQHPRTSGKSTPWVKN